MKAKKKRAVATEVYRSVEPQYDACGTYLGGYLTKTDDQIPIPLALRLVSYAKKRLAATGLSLGKGWRCVVGTTDASGDWEDRSYYVDWRNLKTGFCVAVTGILVKEGAPFWITGSLGRGGCGALSESPYTEADYQCLHYLLAQAEGINRWRERSLRALLNAGPRLAKLGDSFYMGCGFHYDKIRRYAMCVDGLKYDFQPCMNHFEVSKEEYFGWLTTRVVVEGFFKELAEAERSAKQMAREEEEQA